MPAKLPYPVTRIEARIRSTLAMEAELFLPRDFRTGRVAYGAWSEYVERLIREDLDRKAAVMKPHSEEGDENHGEH